MLFFKRILGMSEPEEPPDRRGGIRFAVGAKFPVKTVLNTQGRDEMGVLLKSKDNAGWDWGGRLVNLSVYGARIQVPATMHAHLGDPCKLKFEIDGYQLALPGSIVHIVERRDSFVYGLKLDLGIDESARAYHQLVDLVSLGATLQPVQPPEPDATTGYLLEQYAGENRSRLKVWRQPAGRSIVGFDFRLKHCSVRGLRDRPELEYFVDVDNESVQFAPEAQVAEIRRLFQWVVPNIASAVPADVREFLQEFAG